MQRITIESMARFDYYYNDHAPTPDLIVPSVTVAVSDARRRLLLIQRADNRLWSLPGGSVDIGERVADAAVREVLEETGLEIRLAGLVGIYSDPGHVVEYSNGATRQEFSVCFRAHPIAGVLQPQHSEVADLGWFSLQETMKVPMHPSMRIRLIDQSNSRDSMPRIR
jgi:8-oxo-dGTP pyrophosphatase MutT (NUDIX family)